MTWTVDNPEIESLLAEIVQITGESESEALFIALKERQDQLVVAQEKTRRFHTYLENEIWSQIPPELLGTQLTKAEEDSILGYGEEGFC